MLHCIVDVSRGYILSSAEDQADEASVDITCFIDSLLLLFLYLKHTIKAYKVPYLYPVCYSSFSLVCLSLLTSRLSKLQQLGSDNSNKDTLHTAWSSGSEKPWLISLSLQQYLDQTKLWHRHVHPASIYGCDSSSPNPHNDQ